MPLNSRVRSDCDVSRFQQGVRSFGQVAVYKPGVTVNTEPMPMCDAAAAAAACSLQHKSILLQAGPACALQQQPTFWSGASTAAVPALYQRLGAGSGAFAQAEQPFLRVVGAGLAMRVVTSCMSGLPGYSVANGHLLLVNVISG
jgi:hypothetical protein